MRRFLGLFFICALLFVPAWAAKNSQNVTLTASVQVGSTQLPAGEYKVSWTGTGDSAKVTLAKKGAAPVTVPAKVVDQKNDHTGVATATQGGKEVLQAILLSNVNLVF